MKQYVIFGLKGKLERKLYEVGEKTKFRAPLVECDSIDFSSKDSYYRGASQKKLMFSSLEKTYQEWGRFGHYGDAILITAENGKYGGFHFVINLIGRLAFPKGVLAVDLLVYVYDGAGNVFFIGTKRPEKSAYPGLPAFIGGHIDLKGKHFESALEAVFREAREEVNIDLSLAFLFGEKMIDVKDIPVNSDMLRVNFRLGKIKENAAIQLVTTMRPDEGAENRKMPFKRVDWTFVYMCSIPLPFMRLSKKKLLAMLKGGEDEPMVIDMKNDPAPKFAFTHHQEIYDLWAEEMAGRARFMQTMKK